MLVADFMTSDPVTVSPNTSLESALETMDHVGIRHLPVLDGGRLVGVISNRDLVSVIGWRPYGPDSADEQRPKWVEQVMKTDVITVSPDDPVVAAAVEVSVHAIGCLPVLKDGALIGIVSEMDLVRLVSETATDAAGDARAVSTIASTSLFAITPDATLFQSDELMFAKGVRHVPVVLDDEFVGMVSDRDLRRAVAEGCDPETKVDEFMGKGVISIPSTASIAEAAGLMHSRRISALVVTSDDGGHSIVTITDILEHALGSLGAIA